MAAVGTGAQEHVNNIYHMHRRIEETVDSVCRRPWDAGTRAPPRHKPSSVRSHCPWLPQQQPAAERPRLAPAARHVGPIRTDVDAERYAAFREAILSDIHTHRIYQDAHLKQLFRRWLEANPVEFHPVLLKAIEDVQAELLLVCDL